jgi:hypothetical protein
MPTRLLPFVATLLALALAGPVPSAHAQANVSKVRNLLIDVDSHLTRMELAVKEWERLGSQISQSRWDKFQASVDQAASSYNKAQELLNSMPQDDANVLKMYEQMEPMRVKFGKLQERARSLINDGAAAVEAVGGFEAIQKDVDRVGDIAYQYINFASMMEGGSEEAVEMIKEYNPAVAEVKRLEEKYAEFLERDNADTAPIRNKLATAKKRLAAVMTDGRALLPKVAADAERDLKTADEQITLALEKRSPAFFRDTGSIAQATRQAKTRISIVNAFDTDVSAPLIEKYKATTARATAAGETLKAEIIASNRPKKDAYSGSDLEVLKAGAKAAFLKDNKGREVVRVVMPSSTWDRTTKWTWWRDAFYFTDRSKQQAGIYYKATAEDGSPEVHYLPVNITKDHTKDDAISYSPWILESTKEIDVAWRYLPEHVTSE